MQLISGELTQRHQNRLGADHLTKGGQRRLDTGEPRREQPDHGAQHGPNRPNTSPHPADHAHLRPGVRPQTVGRLPEAGCPLGGGHHLLDLSEGAGQPRGQAVGQQTEGRVSSRAVVAGHPCPRRRSPAVRPVPGEATPTSRVQRAPIQSCLPPCLCPNVFLAGESRIETKLHRPGPHGGYRGGPFPFARVSPGPTSFYGKRVWGSSSMSHPAFATHSNQLTGGPVSYPTAGAE